MAINAGLDAVGGPRNRVGHGGGVVAVGVANPAAHIRADALTTYGHLNGSGAHLRGTVSSAWIHNQRDRERGRQGLIIAAVSYRNRD